MPQLIRSTLSGGSGMDPLHRLMMNMFSAFDLSAAAMPSPAQYQASVKPGFYSTSIDGATRMIERVLDLAHLPRDRCSITPQYNKNNAVSTLVVSIPADEPVSVLRQRVRANYRQARERENAPAITEVRGR